MARGEKGRVTRVSLVFVRFLKISLGLFLKLRYRLVAENLEVLYRVKPPYVILPNHLTTWDPFFIGFFVPGPVYNVTSDFHFRRRIMRIVHRLVGSIPKSKAIPDIETIKRILEVRRKRGIIGIYPEGMRSWDGHTGATVVQTAKLLKFLKIPVVATVMKGAYLSLPRWTKYRRKGKVTIEFSRLFSGPELADLSVDEIHARVDESLRYDEYRFQREQMLPYKCSRPAENLELALFMCPNCEKIGTLRSRGHRFRCRKCGYAVWYNDYGFLERKNGKLYFDTVRKWNVWQQARLESVISETVKNGGADAILDDRGLKMYVGYRTKPVRKRAVGDILLTAGGFRFSSIGGGSISFALSEIDGANVQLGESFEFYHRRVLYRFVSKDRSVSGYKWMSAIKILKRLAEIAESEPVL